MRADGQTVCPCAQNLHCVDFAVHGSALATGGLVSALLNANALADADFAAFGDQHGGGTLFEDLDKLGTKGAGRVDIGLGIDDLPQTPRWMRHTVFGAAAVA